jgi:hypothetical protein
MYLGSIVEALGKVLVVGAFFASQSILAQVEVKNGGDVVNCAPATDSIFSGPYILDYLATYHSYPHDHETGVDNPIQNLRSMLLAIVPEVGRHFDQFVTDYYNQFGENEDPHSDFIWRGSNNRLLAIKDEELDLLSALDKNCYSDAGSGIITLNQVVVRQERPGLRGFIFNYDRRMLDTVKDLPWQKSYLLVHEWLWTFVQRASSVREINAFLHSESASKMDSMGLRYALANLGFNWAPLVGNLPGDIAEVVVESSANGLKRLRVTPDLLIVGPTTNKIRFINMSGFDLEVQIPGSQVARKALPMGNRFQSTEVTIELGSNFRYPGSVSLEIQPLFDPLYDVLHFEIFR